MTTVTKATHITINAANTVPTNAQIILQGQNVPVATQSPGCVTAGKSGGQLFLPNRNDIGWQGVSGATQYNIYRAKNGGSYPSPGSPTYTVSASAAATNYTNYLSPYPAQTPTYGQYLSGLQCSPASGINCAFSDTAATGIIGNGGQAGQTFSANATMSIASTNITINSVSAGALAPGQGIGTVLPTNLQIGTFIVSQTSGTTGGTGVYVISQPALANFTGTVGEVAWGNTGYTYYVTAVTGGVESGASAYAYLPFITNGGLVLCNGTFDSCMGTLQTAPTTTPLGYSQAACWFPIQPTSGGHCTNYPSYLNAFSGNSAVNYNLNTTGYNWINWSVCPSTPGLSPAGGNAEICGDAPLLNPNGAAMAAYGPSSWTQNQWNTYKMPIAMFNTDAVTGVPQTAMYKITWGVGGSIAANTIIYIEYYFSVN